ncbi:hypothetical protein ACOMHN_055285 [Nucella lapillus]
MELLSLSCETAALSPCSLPAREMRQLAEQSSTLNSLLAFEPFAEVKTDRKEISIQARAVKVILQRRTDRRRYTPFLPAVSPTDRARQVLTWHVLHEALTEHNVTHFLVDATLLGALRHNAIIPWDDEMDIGVHHADLPGVQQALSCIPGYTLRVQNCRHWTFFADDAKVVTRFSQSRIRDTPELKEAEKDANYEVEMVPDPDVVVRTPFVDIFLMMSDGDYVWSIPRFNIKTSVYPINDLYPLTEAMFEGRLAPVPRNSVGLVKRAFDANVCVSSNHNHTIGQEISNGQSIPCRELSEIYRMNEL